MTDTQDRLNCDKLRIDDMDKDTTMSTQFTRFVLAIVTACLLGCGSTAQTVPVVTNFDANKYLGTWYEIARLDF